ncbi:MAG: hypothetical protein ACLQVY_13165 [Limisphaerales bacterium]
MATVTRSSFKSLFCEEFKCPPEDYEAQAFRKFLYGHARFLAPVIRTVYPGFFQEDLKFIRYLGDSVDTRQARVDVLDFKDINRKRWRMLHGSLRIRVSGRKASRLALQLFGTVDQADAPASAQHGSVVQ